MPDAKKAMKSDWDERARKNAFFYIASWRKDWDENSFFESGEQDYAALVEPVLKDLQLYSGSLAMAEIGCGAGRMTRAFARRFAAVTAADISSEMQASAKSYLRDFRNVAWVLTDGATLSGIESGSMDFVFSYLVLQHFPARELIFSMIREMLRILRPGGAFLFQYNGSERPTMNWKGRTVSAILDGLCSIGLRRVSQSLARLSGIDSEMVGGTWRGAALQSAEVEAAVRAAGGSPVAFLGERTPMAWCYGRRVSGGQD